jgi:hypothetical protein
MRPGSPVLQKEEREMALSHCPVCGCDELRKDEVFDRGALRLTECPRCEFRIAERSGGLARPLRIVWEASEEIAAA